MSNSIRQRGTPCPACSFRRRACPPSCESVKIFRNTYNRRDYHTIFSVFGVKSVEFFLQHVPDHKHRETLDSFLFEAKARILNPAGGCAALLTSLDQKFEALQSRMTALEARLDSESPRVNPSFSFAPPTSSLHYTPPHSIPPHSPSSTPLSPDKCTMYRTTPLSGRRRHRSTGKLPEKSPASSSFASPSGSFTHPSGSFTHPSGSFASPPGSFNPPASSSRANPSDSLAHPPGSFASPSGPSENPLEPGVLPIQENLLEHPHYKSLLKLLLSTPDIRLPTVNLSEHGDPLTAVDMPAYPTLSDYQVALDGFSKGSPQISSVAEVAGSMTPDWTALGDIGYNSLSASNFTAILNFGADDSQNPSPFSFLSQ
ncbi:hypothetical protein LguiA_010796 [Lonicera macranthoides]